MNIYEHAFSLLKNGINFILILIKRFIDLFFALFLYTNLMELIAPNVPQLTARVSTAGCHSQKNLILLNKKHINIEISSSLKKPVVLLEQ